MKREEKSQKMRRKIMDSALTEFSNQGYGVSSINTICATENISKGIVYHYFATKDDLYLACIEECFQQLTAYIRSKFSIEGYSIEKNLSHYFSLRTHFFQEHPIYQHLFCEAIITPPTHLKTEIQNRKQEFDLLNNQILKQLLSFVSLRDDISIEHITEIFRQFQDFINIRYQMTDLDSHTFEMREENCQRALNIFLYGVILRKDDCEDEK